MMGVMLLLLMQPVSAVPRADLLIAEIARSGRVLDLSDTRERVADPRRGIAPGSPPLLSFRYFAGADRHRFGNLDVMLDDAGH
jgi:hypothetical protein